MLLPILSLLPFIDRNFDEKFAVLKAGPHYGQGPGRGYNTMKLALEDGAVIMSWGYVLLPSFLFSMKRNPRCEKRTRFTMMFPTDWVDNRSFPPPALSSTKSSTSSASVSRCTLLHLCTDGRPTILSSNILSNASTAGRGSVRR